jgi:hypothetical protein
MTNEKTAIADDPEADLFESFKDILDSMDTEYRTVKAWGGKYCRIGSLTANQMITFLENNDDPTKKRTNGVMLIAQSLVDKQGKRLVDAHDATALSKAMEQLREKDANVNGHVVEQILILNGLNRKDAADVAKNVSGEAPTGASPIAT